MRAIMFVVNAQIPCPSEWAEGSTGMGTLISAAVKRPAQVWRAVVVVMGLHAIDMHRLDTDMLPTCSLPGSFSRENASHEILHRSMHRMLLLYSCVHANSSITCVHVK